MAKLSKVWYPSVSQRYYLRYGDEACEKPQHWLIDWLVFNATFNILGHIIEVSFLDEETRECGGNLQLQHAYMYVLVGLDWIDWCLTPLSTS